MLIGMDGIRTCFCFTLDWLSRELREVRFVTHVWCQPARHQKARNWCYLPQLAAKIKLTPTRQKVAPITFHSSSWASPLQIFPKILFTGWINEVVPSWDKILNLQYSLVADVLWYTRRGNRKKMHYCLYTALLLLMKFVSVSLCNVSQNPPKQCLRQIEKNDRWKGNIKIHHQKKTFPKHHLFQQGSTRAQAG